MYGLVRRWISRIIYPPRLFHLGLMPQGKIILEVLLDYIIIVRVERFILHVIIYFNVRNILIYEIVFSESLFELLKIRISENLLLLGNPILSFNFMSVHKNVRKLNDFNKTQIHRVILLSAIHISLVQVYRSAISY